MTELTANHALHAVAQEKARWAAVLGNPEADRVAGDLANNVNKAERAYAVQERSAMRLQLQHESRDYP